MLLVLPAAGSLTDRREEKAAWIQHRMGTMTAGSEMQSKSKVRGGIEGKVKAWKKEDEQK